MSAVTDLGEIRRRFPFLMYGPDIRFCVSGALAPDEQGRVVRALDYLVRARPEIMEMRSEEFLDFLEKEKISLQGFVAQSEKE